MNDEALYVNSQPRWMCTPISRYSVVLRSNQCITCGLCATLCPYGVFNIREGYNRMPLPDNRNCIGPICEKNAFYCVKNCPTEAISVEINPNYISMGDVRWTNELLLTTLKQSETKARTNNDGIGASGGGFDKLKIIYPKDKFPLSREEISTDIKLNRRKEGPNITISLPFYGGGMSFGSVSLNVMLARAMAAKASNTFTCTGEGGYPDQLIPYKDYIITQIATGLFGVREETIQRARFVEFKYAQGAKPGLGGHLLAAKVTPIVAEMREALPWNSLFSPFPFHSVYSVEDHKKHIDWIKATNPDALVSIKVSTPTDVDMVSIGIYYAGANIVHLDGGYGGTGAAPDIAKKNIALPIEYAIPKVHQFLSSEGVRDKVVLMVSGGIRSAQDVLKAIALGADGAVIGTADLVALGCVRCGNCESGRGCPYGIATTDQDLSKLIDPLWGMKRIMNMYTAWREEIVETLSKLGLKNIGELRGRANFLWHEDYGRGVSINGE